MSRTLVDTSAYSAYMRSHPEVTQRVRQAPEIGLSVVSIGELRSGFAAGSRRRRNEEFLRRFLASPRVRILAVDEEIADR